eukprot:XP_019858189.1 PREDICTED: uncharacterized protein LOC109586445 [Amphimedon queenslandica]
MKPICADFQARARESLQDSNLAVAMGRARKGFIDGRLAAVDALTGYDELRRCAQEIKEHTLAHLDYYLERFEERVREHGGHVHWAATPAEAQSIIVDICKKAKAKRVTKGKSMVGEEIAVNEALEAAGFEAIETDLGEYIIQLADEPPSHIIAPAIHKTRDQVSDLFHLHHAPHGYERQTEPEALVAEARSVLREKFTSAEVGITGANFLVAETGSSVIVTNEGNGDLTNTLPDVHIVTAGIEKVIPNLEDLSAILRVLARNATGQEASVYTTHRGFQLIEKPATIDGAIAFHRALWEGESKGTKRKGEIRIAHRDRSEILIRLEDHRQFARNSIAAMHRSLESFRLLDGY